ncbi:hypothetical protein NIES4103_41000 [Nostoc sp. NIES-4103]|nr:hypothetical protein NIES4103_41000 [Nostoc sp. NIES-4103]
MKTLKTSLIILGSFGLLLGSCSNTNQVANIENSSATSTSTTKTPSVPPSSATKTDSEHGASHGGQVVETGSYHLEFVQEKEASATHIDLYLLKGENHQTVPNAKVTAQVQLPNGQQKTIPLSYDTDGKHYTAKLTEKATGQYQVKVIADIGGEKVNGRFTFAQ